MKILFACGGTGGHIFPAFSVAEELKKRHPHAQLIYVCGKKDIENKIFKIIAGEEVSAVESAPFRGVFSLFNPAFLIKLFSGFSQSWRLLKRERPDLVAGFGGHFSFPVVLMARLLGIRTLIHEQNVVPGVANQWLVRFVDAVALSFEETKKFLPAMKSVRVTGNPIRSSIEKDCRQEALKFFGFDGGKITWLVLGGSQGAESINTTFMKLMEAPPLSWKSKVQILHLCGKMPSEEVERALRRTGISGKVYSFFERMDLAYGAADLALGRAGATFLAEIWVKEITAVLVPYPYGRGHQLVNAEVFSREKSALVVKQEDLSPEKLVAVLEELFEVVEKKKMGAGRPPATLPNARAALADFIETLVSDGH